jgi:hypothetical protein
MALALTVPPERAKPWRPDLPHRSMAIARHPVGVHGPGPHRDPALALRIVTA